VTGHGEPSDAPLMVVRGDASDEEVAALVAVLQGLTAAATEGRRDRPVPAWSSRARMVRGAHPHGLGGWRASALPR
jgi:Acyl-CoA carboxylase epsilon subunit